MRGRRKGVSADQIIYKEAGAEGPAIRDYTAKPLGPKNK